MSGILFFIFVRCEPLKKDISIDYKKSQELFIFE